MVCWPSFFLTLEPIQKRGWLLVVRDQVNTSLAWSWHHPEGRFHTLTFGTVLDHEQNVYLAAADGLRKFDPHGKVLWEHKSLPAHIINSPAIYQGAVYATDTFGGVRAVDMVTGEKLWHTEMGEAVGDDNGFNVVHGGVVVTAADWRAPAPTFLNAANQKIRALNASTGGILWTYTPDTTLWNFLPLFPDDKTVVFQDMSGRVYRLGLFDGREIWKAGGIKNTWTDGSAALGSNGLVYSVSNNWPSLLGITNLSGLASRHLETSPGTLSAYDLDGNLKWKVTTPKPPNNAPAVGKIHGWDGLSVIMPICQQVQQGATCDVHAYDAESGRLRWVFNGPTQKGLWQAADLEGIGERVSSGIQKWCMPNGWSAPSIGADGTVYLGSEEGPFFALRDADRDGRVLGEQEATAPETKRPQDHRTAHRVAWLGTQTELRSCGKVRSARPVTLHLYSLGDGGWWFNKVMSPFGLAAFHCGVEVHGEEWSFCDTSPDFKDLAVISYKPKSSPGHVYERSVPMGVTHLSKSDLKLLLRRMSARWPGPKYNVLNSNCCHFCDEFCMFLGVGPVPNSVFALAAAAKDFFRSLDALEVRRQGWATRLKRWSPSRLFEVTCCSGTQERETDNF
ncbi:unnamed protein product [Effrenium voratum]|nr:unnamed protein product [Effrenium voratum]